MDWPATIPAPLRAVLNEAVAGLPPNVALMHLLMRCGDVEDGGDALRAAIGARQGIAAQRLSAVLDLLLSNPDAGDVVRSILGGLDHTRDGRSGDPAHWASAFDRAVRIHPEAGVALYALGDPALLEAATAEIVARLREWDALAPGCECLDIGCGIGRIEAAVAGTVRRIVGIDISEGMVAEARRRTSGFGNVEIRLASGADLGEFGDGSFDLVLAVDSLPYMVQSGPDLVRRMVAEIARVLRSGGRLVIFNYSYRGDLDRDERELSTLVADAGLEIVRTARSDFKLWDGATFDLRRGLASDGGQGST